MKARRQEGQEVSVRGTEQGVGFRPVIYSPAESAGSLQAEIIGEVREEPARVVLGRTRFGGTA